MRCTATTLGILSAIALTVDVVAGDDGEKLLTIDHYVRVKSTVPAIAGQPAQIYVRERSQAGAVLRAPSVGDRVVLFVHGAGTPAEVSFDVPYADYSWMAFLAHAGFDVFAMDTTGYGRSTRPAPMNDPCNLAKNSQAAFVPSLIPAPCPPTYPHQLTTIASDWDDVGAVVDYVRALRHVDKVSLIAWSLGGPRAGGYTALHPEKVQKLILLAPAYNRGSAPTPPAILPPDGVPMNTQSRAEFNANWDRQVGCPDQYEAAASDAVWTTTWGWNAAAVGKTQIPTLMVAGAHDKQVPPDRVQTLLADLGTPHKVLVDLACSSHNAMWEKNHLLLFRASLEWLTSESVKGTQSGTIKLGY